MVTLNRLFSTGLLQSRQAMFIGGLLLSGSVIISLMTLFYISEKNDYLENVKLQERYALKLQQARIAETFDSLLQDLFFLRDQNELTSLLQTDSQVDRESIAREYVTMAKRTRMYDRIRLIDNRGMEVVSVNFNNGTPAIVPQSGLKGMDHSQSFTNCIDSEQGEVFISPFDLSVRDGQVEQPPKPVIRLGTTVFDRQGKKQGIVLLNFLGHNLFDKLLATEDISLGHLMLLNRKGYWLHNQDRTFINSRPEVWAAIKEEKKGQLLTGAGLFTFATIHPLDCLEPAQTNSLGQSDSTASEQAGYHWVLISQVANKDLSAHPHHLLLKVIPLALGVFLVSVVGSWMLSSAVEKRRTYQEQLKTMAYFDVLTELPNRRHFFDRLEQSIAYKQRYGNDLALMYIDLDGFKQVNDTLGHQSGDALLRQAAKDLREICRKTDILARLGGDEFAVLVPQYSSIEDVALVAEKIISTLSAPFEIDGKVAQVGASIGIALYPADCKHQADLLSYADAAMYHAKSLGKNQYIFYNEIPDG